MRTYKEGQTVRWDVQEVWGYRFSELATITEVFDDHAIAKGEDGMTLWIDDDTEYMFTRL